MAWWKAGLSRSREFHWHRFNWRLLSVLVLIIGGFHCTTPRAQTSAPCPQDNLDECTRYQHILAGMDSGDLVVQIASLRAASQELDPAFRALIFGKALSHPRLTHSSGCEIMSFRTERESTRWIHLRCRWLSRDSHKSIARAGLG